MARIAALGDAHLGRSYLNRTTPEGVNQREVDFEVAFDAAVDLALAQSPDAIVWLGDVFDHPRPTYRSFRVAQRALARIRDHGIPTVVITGNHDTPRLPGTGSPYSALADTFGGTSGSATRFAHRLAYERFELDGLGVVVHAVPQMLTVQATLDALAEADRTRSADRVNLLLTHPRLPQVEPKYADINEIEVDAGELRSDLVLLGHYHSFASVGSDPIWYAGSTDTFTFADDPDAAKGIVLLDTDAGTCEHLALHDQRPLVTLDTIEAPGLSPAEVQALVLERAAAVPPGAVARLFVDQVEPEAWRLLDLAAVHDAAAAGLDLRLVPTFAGGQKVAVDVDLQSMPARWDAYVKDQDLTGYDRDRLHDLGHRYLVAAVDEAAGAGE